MYKDLRFTLENREYPYGKITPIWTGIKEGFSLEGLRNKSVSPRQNFQKEVFKEMMIEAFSGLSSLHEANHFIHIESPESIASIEWSSMISFMAVIWENIPERSPLLQKIREGLKFQMLSYINAYSALINAGCRADSGGMQMECTYISESLWQIFTSEGLGSKWMFEVNRTRKRVADGHSIAWAI